MRTLKMKKTYNGQKKKIIINTGMCVCVCVCMKLNEKNLTMHN